MVSLGWARHPRVQEWLAWFEATEGWERDTTAAVAVLGACGGGLRPTLQARAVDGLGTRLVASRGNNFTTFGHPNLLRTDLAEIFANLAGAGVEFRRQWRRLLDEAAAPSGWDGEVVAASRRFLGTLAVPEPEQPSRWITLKATKALLTYAVDAELPRLFPFPPKHKVPSKK